MCHFVFGGEGNLNALMEERRRLGPLEGDIWEMDVCWSTKVPFLISASRWSVKAAVIASGSYRT